MDKDVMQRMQALLAKFNELEHRVTELQDKTASVLHDFENAVSPQTQLLHPLDDRDSFGIEQPFAVM